MRKKTNKTLETFSKAWSQVMRGETHPIEELWIDFDEDTQYCDYCEELLNDDNSCPNCGNAELG